ncbi:MAG: hypothetical protein M1482_12695 [Chloroflexi bacterium]|nr:hypothetical protein [Chloroflexota bacterium]
MSTRAVIVPTRTWTERRVLVALLVLSFALRALLVVRGGQLYFPDEGRYFRSLDFVSLVAHGDPAGALDLLVASPENPGFLLLGTIPAAAEYAAETLFGHAARSAIWIPGLVIAMVSVSCIALVYAVARRAGAAAGEALLAAGLTAAAASMFYYSRHLVPYDISLALSLAALWLGLDERTSVVRSLACGILAGLAFFTYFGYWSLALVVCLVHVLWGRPKLLDVLIRGAAAAVGVVLLPVVLTGVSVAAGATPFVDLMAQFAGTVNQGTFSEGWRLPWQYLWDAEHGLVLIWAAGAVLLVWMTVAHRDSVPRRAMAWMGAAAALYLILAVGSTGLEKFVVYGRLARVLVPFFCLAAAAAVVCISGRLRLNPKLAPYAMILVAVQVALNFWQPIVQQFPAQVQQAVESTYGPVGRALTVKGPPVFGSDPSVSSRYVLVNAQYLYPIQAPKKPPAGTVLLRTPHPLQYLPYQFEGYDPVERSVLQSVDLSIRLIQTP